MTVRRRRSDRSGRSKLHSPGRPDSARREELVRFWAAIATGRSSEDAARDAGVSPGRLEVVPEVGRHATITFIAIGQAAVRTLPVFRGT